MPRAETPSKVVSEFDRLYNGVRQFGRPRLALVGTDRAVLVHFRSGREWVTVNAKLPGGTVYVRGDARRSQGLWIAPVTGGTGRYAGVRGSLTVLDLPYPGLAANVYRLRR